jgi:hypothetical protein
VIASFLFELALDGYETGDLVLDPSLDGVGARWKRFPT